MDKSLDQLIKENPRKYTAKGAKNNIKGKKNVLNKKKAAGKIVKAKSRVQPQKNAGKNLKSRIGNQKGKTTKPASPNKVVDARTKLLAKKRQSITDARERLSSKKVDLRQKLAKKNENSAQRRPNPRLRQNGRPRPENATRSPASILTRTVFNNPAVGCDPGYGRSPLHFASSSAAPVYQDSYNLGQKRNSAAMDWELMSKRTRVLDNRLGPKEYAKPAVAEPTGYKIVIDNLHPTVTQEDIEELFGDIGPLVKAVLKRPGLGEVVYSHRQDALRAVDTYHNRQLDGMPMQVAIAENRPEPPPIYHPPSARSGSGKSSIQPDVNTIHKALFNKAGSRSQVFTVTLPKKDF